jgi:hypothetical protein
MKCIADMMRIFTEISKELEGRKHDFIMVWASRFVMD